MCSDGIAASWLACDASAPVCHEPRVCVEATTSTNPGEHPRRRDREAPEDDEPEHVDEHQRVAQRPVDVSPPPPQEAEQPERHDEVGVVVVVGQHQAERVVPGQPAVERMLRIDVQRAARRSGCSRAWASATCSRSGARFVIASYTQHSHAIVSTSTHQRVRAARERQRLPGADRAPRGSGRARTRSVRPSTSRRC